VVWGEGDAGDVPCGGAHRRVAETLNRRFVVLTAVGSFVGRSSAVCWSA
jgi:hypothetical protein